MRSALFSERCCLASYVQCPLRLIHRMQPYSINTNLPRPFTPVNNLWQYAAAVFRF